MRQVIVDTETTGLSPQEGHRIIEIGCVELINRRITGRRWQQYINPQREIESSALAVHGISGDFLLDKPVFSAIVDDFLSFIQGAELIIHNAPFDVGFLDYELGRADRSNNMLATSYQVTDTLVLARQIHPGQRNSLDALCKRYGIDLSKRELHGALLDANLLAQVYLAMTGGQASLFDSLGSPAVETSTFGETRPEKDCNDVASVRPVLPLRVIHADGDELLLHENKMAELRKTGKCIW